MEIKKPIAPGICCYTILSAKQAINDNDNEREFIQRVVINKSRTR